MKLPHKLDKELSDEKELRVWLNQLRDYLSDKEEDNLACCGGRVTEKDLEEYLSKDKEASKGECQHVYERVNGPGIERSNYCLKCNIHPKPHPPQQEELKSPDFDLDKFKESAEKARKTFEQEESRGECICPKTSWKGGITRIADCPIHGIHQGEPQLKEESPKEDECFSYIRNMLVSEEYSTLEIMTYLRKHLVSKEKIKRLWDEKTKRYDRKDSDFEKGWYMGRKDILSYLLKD